MKNRIYFSLLMLFVLAPFAALRAQMAVVYDKVEEPLTEYNQMLLDPDGQVRLFGKKGEDSQYLRLTPRGTIAHSKTILGFTAMNVAKAKDGSMIVVGGKENGSVPARFIKYGPDDKILQDYQHPGKGYFDKVVCLRDGAQLLSGVEWQKGGGYTPFFVVVSASGKMMFGDNGSESEYCSALAETNEGDIVIVFSSEDGDARMLKYTLNGREVFAVTLPGSFMVNNLRLTRSGELVVAGTTGEEEARVAKVRPEGAIVFDKVFNPGVRNGFTHLEISPKNEILLGGYVGNGGQLQYLRNDGTTLFTTTPMGAVSAMGISPKGDVIASCYNESTSSGSIMKVTPSGKVLFEHPVASKYDYLKIGVDGETALISTSTGRPSILREDGTIAIDKKLDRSEDPGLLVSGVADNGDIVMAGKNGRVAKIGHSLIINDIVIQEPLNGFAMANFTVTLTGFQRPQGVPAPVSVQYKVKEGTAGKDDVVIASGLLSFVPIDDGRSGSFVTQTIEVPIKADNILEGDEEFMVVLEQAENSYISKGEGRGTITDQPALVRAISSEPGREPSTSIAYTVGLFKTDGTPVTNMSGSDIIVKGLFGEGTATEDDYTSSVRPRFVIGKGQSQASFRVGVVSDDKYEIPETVILQLTQVEGMSDLSLQLEGGVVNCIGYIYDQPATIALMPLGDKGKSSNTVQSFFRAALLRASDDMPLVNCTGSNILISCEIDPSSTAIKGEDFVLTNESDLSIPGDCQKTAVNITGVVLNNTNATGNTSVSLRLTSFTTPENAGSLNIHPSKGKSSFSIIDTRKQ